MMGPRDTYAILTGYGAVDAAFPPDSTGIVLEGPAEAVEYLRQQIRRATNIDGVYLAQERIEPHELMAIASAPGSPITVIAPPELEDAS